MFLPFEGYRAAATRLVDECPAFSSSLTHISLRESWHSSNMRSTLTSSLREATASIAAQEWARPTEEAVSICRSSPEDELALLARTMNQMADSLEKTQAQLLMAARMAAPAYDCWRKIAHLRSDWHPEGP